LLLALNNFNNISLIFTLPNSDLGGKLISEKIIDFVANHSNSRVYASLGRIGYLSCLANVDGVIGNSSSGILEAPFFNVPTINIGNRQKGRVQSNTIINVLPEHNEITSAIQKVLTLEGRPSLLSDFTELYQTKTSIFLEDTDSDGFSDAEEINAGFSPLCAGNVLLFASCLEN
jgi:UDP-N-acetylglucosamine 2-epimerase